jgi:hypothetical protein
MTVNKVISVRYGTGHNNYCRERGFTIMIASQTLLQCLRARTNYNYTDPGLMIMSESADINIMIESKDSLLLLHSKFHYYDSESDLITMFTSHGSL